MVRGARHARVHGQGQGRTLSCRRCDEQVAATDTVLTDARLVYGIDRGCEIEREVVEIAHKTGEIAVSEREEAADLAA